MSRGSVLVSSGARGTLTFGPHGPGISLDKGARAMSPAFRRRSGNVGLRGVGQEVGRERRCRLQTCMSDLLRQLAMGLSLRFLLLASIRGVAEAARSRL